MFLSANLDKIFEIIHNQAFFQHYLVDRTSSQYSYHHLVAAVCVRRRSSTKARIIPRLTLIAADERSTLLNIATPNSVKANGRYFMFWPRFTFKVPIWHLDNSSKVTQLLCLQLEKLPMSAEHALEKVSF